ncbi:MAG: peptide chain release factor N(5)-glutamine methyltransferase [Gammaproteobacteria bacterium]|nr:peptide chain release factor N(5)-glutamine methyltransferase [Gammaproteobacteria bacterium]
MQSISSAIQWAQSLFEKVSDSARLDAELLLAHSLQKPRSHLYSWPEKTLQEPAWQEFQQLVELRLKPTPVAYLLVEREFYSLKFKISPVALIPRPETELLVDTTLQLCADIEHPRVLEMGTGSGAISIALLKHNPSIELITTDICADCLALAQANAKLNNVTLDCIKSCWYDNLHDQPAFDLIVSNPPYIAAADPYLRQGDLPAEPLLALTPGKTGLEAIQQIVTEAATFLKPGGYLVFEHGYNQGLAVADLLRIAGFTRVKNLLDFNGLARLSLGQLSLEVTHAPDKHN